jgi:hypothetical protein
MPFYCTMVKACGQIGGYPIRSYRAPAAYVEHAEVPFALRRNMPPIVPVLVLGRMAVDKEYQGVGVGVPLFWHAL